MFCLGPRWGAYSDPQILELVGRGLAAPPQEPHPASSLGSPFALPWKNPAGAHECNNPHTSMVMHWS